MLSEALAGSASIPLMSTSYTGLQKGGHLGNYLKAMSDVVAEALAAAPCVIFIDDLGSFGSRGGAASDTIKQLVGRSGADRVKIARDTKSIARRRHKTAKIGCALHKSFSSDS